MPTKRYYRTGGDGTRTIWNLTEEQAAILGDVEPVDEAAPNLEPGNEPTAEDEPPEKARQAPTKARKAGDKSRS